MLVVARHYYRSSFCFSLSVCERKRRGEKEKQREKTGNGLEDGLPKSNASVNLPHSLAVGSCSAFVFVNAHSERAKEPERERERERDEQG